RRAIHLAAGLISPRPTNHPTSAAPKYASPIKEVGSPVPGIDPNALAAALAQGLPRPHPGSSIAPKCSRTSMPDAPAAMRNEMDPTIQSHIGAALAVEGPGDVGFCFMGVESVRAPSGLRDCHSPVTVVPA